MFYFDSLLAATSKRNSESLQVTVATMASQGLVSSRDVEEAYNYFAIGTRAAPLLVDEHILGIFQSRLADSGPGQEAELRKRLRIIGQARGSATLLDAADTCKFFPFPTHILHRPRTPTLSFKLAARCTVSSCQVAARLQL